MFFQKVWIWELSPFIGQHKSCFSKKQGTKKDSFTKASLMAQCLVGTFIYAAPGIIFNYAWDTVACHTSDKKTVCFCIQHKNLCHVCVNPWSLSATKVLTGGLWRRKRCACILSGGESASHLLRVEEHRQALWSEPSTVYVSSHL